MRATWAVVALVACSGTPTRRSVISVNAPSEYPGVLRDPKAVPHDFMVRQTLAIHTKRDGKPVDAEFDAVVQKQTDTLLIVGFGPMNVKAFTLTQKADRIEFAQFMGPEPPFSPRNVVVDVHRVYFMRLPQPSAQRSGVTFSGVLDGQLDGETVQETWKDGQLRSTVFTRPNDPKLKGAVRIELGPGCVPVYCEPETATLHNEWFGYTLNIVNEAYERL